MNCCQGLKCTCQGSQKLARFQSECSAVRIQRVLKKHCGSCLSSACLLQHSPSSPSTSGHIPIEEQYEAKHLSALTQKTSLRKTSLTRALGAWIWICLKRYKLAKLAKATNPVTLNQDCFLVYLFFWKGVI